MKKNEKKSTKKSNDLLMTFFGRNILKRKACARNDRGYQRKLKK